MHSLAEGLHPSYYFRSTRYGFYAASCCWTGENTLPFLIKCLVDSIFSGLLLPLLVWFGLLVVQFSRCIVVCPSAPEVPGFCIGADCIIECQFEFINRLAN
jgi:hypothetical protein